MAKLILFNKPFQVLSQFTDKQGRQNLSDFIKLPAVYPAGRLDYDSEGLLLLTDDGQLQAQIANPKHKMPKHYWVFVEGQCNDAALEPLRQGITLNDGPCKPAQVSIIAPPPFAAREIARKNTLGTWLEIIISEGRNRQVRRMTAHVGYPTLRLIRHQIGPWRVDGIKPGQYEQIKVFANKQKPAAKRAGTPSSKPSSRPSAKRGKKPQPKRR